MQHAELMVDTTLAEFSDLSFVTALVIYTIALVFSLVMYMKLGTAAEGDAAAAAGARKWGGMTQALAYLGIIFHAVAIVLRGLSVHRFPLGNLYEYVLMITGLAMLAAAVTIRRTAWRAIWPWVFVPVLALMFFGGTKLYVGAAPVIPALQSFWLPYHVSSVSIGGSIGMISGIFSLLYLLRMRQPKGAEEVRGKSGVGRVFSRAAVTLARPLPTAKTLDKIAYRAAIFSFPVFGLGIVLGAVWAEAVWGRAWGWDPKETISFVTWILYAAYLHARSTAGWKAYWTAWINILALGTMVFNLFFINMVVSGLHSYAGLN